MHGRDSDLYYTHLKAVEFILEETKFLVKNLEAWLGQEYCSSSLNLRLYALVLGHRTYTKVVVLLGFQ